jgi:hypothetical protein
MMPVLFQQQQAGGDVLTADEVRASLVATDVVRCKRISLEAAAALEEKATQEAVIAAAEAEEAAAAREAPDTEAFVSGQLEAPPEPHEQDLAPEVRDDPYDDFDEQARQFQIAEDDEEGIRAADEAAREAEEMRFHFGEGETGSGTAEEEGSGTEAEADKVGTCSS